MVVNFRAREISRGAYKLARTSTLNKKKKKQGPSLTLIAFHSRGREMRRKASPVNQKARGYAQL